MYKMFEVLFYTFFWWKFSEIFTSYKANCASAVYATIYILMYSYYQAGNYYILDDMYFWSVGYFIYDGLRLVNLNLAPKTPTNTGLVVHHIIAIMFLNDMFNGYFPEYISYVLFLGEVSNLPGFITYYFIKEKHELLESSILVQTFIYTTVRVLVMGYFILSIDMSIFPLYYLVLFFAIYAMGLVWSYKLVLQSIDILTETATETVENKME